MTTLGRCAALLLLVVCVSWGPVRVTEIHCSDQPVRLLRTTLTALA